MNSIDFTLGQTTYINYLLNGYDFVSLPINELTLFDLPQTEEIGNLYIIFDKIKKAYLQFELGQRKITPGFRFQSISNNHTSDILHATLFINYDLTKSFTNELLFVNNLNNGLKREPDDLEIRRVSDICCKHYHIRIEDEIPCVKTVWSTSIKNTTLNGLYNPKTEYESFIKDFNETKINYINLYQNFIVKICKLKLDEYPPSN